jgi:hypothetical protein
MRLGMRLGQFSYFIALGVRVWWGETYLCVAEDLSEGLEELLGVRGLGRRGVELQELEELDLHNTHRTQRGSDETPP